MLRLRQMRKRSFLGQPEACIEDLAELLARRHMILTSSSIPLINQEEGTKAQCNEGDS